jgi:hypothetical protein
MDMSLLDNIEKTTTSLGETKSLTSETQTTGTSSSATSKYPAGVQLGAKMFRNLAVGVTKDFRDVIRGQQMLELMVEGLNVDRLFTKINLETIRPIGIDKKHDEKFSGTYVVTEVIDKFINGLYMQVIKINSADYGG